MPFSAEEAYEVGEKIGIDWDEVEFDSEALAIGMDVELEHGTQLDETDVTSDAPDATAKIAWAHLLEAPNYYDLLSEMEELMEDVNETQRERSAYQIEKTVKPGEQPKQQLSSELENIVVKYTDTLEAAIAQGLNADDAFKQIMPDLDELEPDDLVNLLYENPQVGGRGSLVKFKDWLPALDIYDVVQKLLERYIWEAAVHWWGTRKTELQDLQKSVDDKQKADDESAQQKAKEEDSKGTQVGKGKQRKPEVQDDAPTAVLPKEGGFTYQGHLYREAVIRSCEQRDMDPDRSAVEQKVCLFTKDGKELLGRHPDEESAKEQEAAIHSRGGSIPVTLSVVSNSLPRGESNDNMKTNQGRYIKLAEVPESATKSLYDEKWGEGIMKALGEEFPLDSKAAQFLFFSTWNAVIQLMDKSLMGQEVDTTQFSDDPTFMQSLAGLAYFVADDAIKSSLGVASDSLDKGKGHAEALMQVLGKDADADATLKGLKQKALPIVDKAFDQVTSYLKEDEPAAKAASTKRTRAEVFLTFVKTAGAPSVLNFLDKELGKYDEWFETDAGDAYANEFTSWVEDWAAAIEEATKDPYGEGGDLDYRDIPQQLADILFKLDPDWERRGRKSLYWDLKDIEAAALQMAYEPEDYDPADEMMFDRGHEIVLGPKRAAFGDEDAEDWADRDPKIIKAKRQEGDLLDEDAGMVQDNLQEMGDELAPQDLGRGRDADRSRDAMTSPKSADRMIRQWAQGLPHDMAGHASVWLYGIVAEDASNEDWITAAEIEGLYIPAQQRDIPYVKEFLRDEMNEQLTTDLDDATEAGTVGNFVYTEQDSRWGLLYETMAVEDVIGLMGMKEKQAAPERNRGARKTDRTKRRRPRGRDSRAPAMQMTQQLGRQPKEKGEREPQKPEQQDGWLKRSLRWLEDKSKEAAPTEASASPRSRWGRLRQADARTAEQYGEQWYNDEIRRFDELRSSIDLSELSPEAQQWLVATYIEPTDSVLDELIDKGYMAYYSEDGLSFTEKAYAATRILTELLRGHASAKTAGCGCRNRKKESVDMRTKKAVPAEQYQYYNLRDSDPEVFRLFDRLHGALERWVELEDGPELLVDHGSDEQRSERNDQAWDLHVNQSRRAEDLVWYRWDDLREVGVETNPEWMNMVGELYNNYGYADPDDPFRFSQAAAKPLDNRNTSGHHRTKQAGCGCRQKKESKPMKRQAVQAREFGYRWLNDPYDATTEDLREFRLFKKLHGFLEEWSQVVRDNNARYDTVQRLEDQIDDLVRQLGSRRYSFMLDELVDHYHYDEDDHDEYYARTAKTKQAGCGCRKKDSDMKRQRAADPSIEGSFEETIKVDPEWSSMGKFNHQADEVVYGWGLDGMEDESLGDVDGFGYYELHLVPGGAYVEDHDGGWTFEGAILHTDSQGFVAVEYYDDAEKANVDWVDLEFEYNEFLNEAGGSDSDYFNY